MKGMKNLIHAILFKRLKWLSNNVNLKTFQTLAQYIMLLNYIIKEEDIFYFKLFVNFSQKKLVLVVEN
jgi:hypothetical protein